MIRCFLCGVYLVEYGNSMNTAAFDVMSQRKEALSG